MSEEYYDYDNENEQEESEGDEFYYNSESEDELEGGAYQLSTDYIDSMGMGYGGVLMGGAKQKNCISDYNLFFKKYRKLKYTPAEIGKMWRTGKGRMPKRVAPKGRELCKPSSRTRSGSKKSTSKRNKTTRKKRSVVRKGKLCKLNGKYYKTPTNYTRYCSELAQSKLKEGWRKVPRNIEPPYYRPEPYPCPTGSRYCPLTGRCRKDNQSIIDCYDAAELPYRFNSASIPVASYRGSDNRYYTVGEVEKLYELHPEYQYFSRGKLLKKNN